MGVNMQRTLSILKPNITQKNLTGEVNAHFENEGLRIIAQKRLFLTRTQAEDFYHVHKERMFFNDLCAFMSSGPIVVQVLEGEDAVAKNRTLMGATNPVNAEKGTIRYSYGESIEANAVHGSDSIASAAEEISFFFSGMEIVG